MENIIKSSFRLEPFLNKFGDDKKVEEILSRLEYGAKLHERHSRITFKIGKDTIYPHLVVEARQGKNPNGNYATEKELIQIAKELFKEVGKFAVTIPVRPNVYHESPVEIVDSKWILGQMHSNKITLKQLCLDTGVDKTSMSAYANGLKPLSQTVKSMFYYYFKSIRVAE